MSRGCHRRHRRHLRLNAQAFGEMPGAVGGGLGDRVARRPGRLLSTTGSLLLPTSRFRSVALPRPVTSPHRSKTLLWYSNIFIPSGMIPGPVLEDRVLRKAGTSCISSASIGQHALSTVSGFKRYSPLLLTPPMTAMFTRLAVGRVARTMPTFLLFSLSFIRHTSVNRQTTFGHS